MRFTLSFLAITALQTLVSSSQNAQIPISEDYTCENPTYRTIIVSRSPLVIYIKNFLTQRERDHLQEVTKDTYERSFVAGHEGAAVATVRTSQSTYMPRDSVVRCIEARALAFQGYDIPTTHLERLQLVKYGPGERYHRHTDWFKDPVYHLAAGGGNRISSFFAYVHVSNDTTGGGTNFPLIQAPRDKRWCEEKIIDCDEQWENGVTFRPQEGNAIFWENLLPNGNGDPRVLHAGLSLTGGTKIGMNIWTRQAPLTEEARGPDV